jgi:hypothetical protein
MTSFPQTRGTFHSRKRSQHSCDRLRAILRQSGVKSEKKGHRYCSEEGDECSYSPDTQDKGFAIHICLRTCELSLH